MIHAILRGEIAKYLKQKHQSILMTGIKLMVQPINQQKYAAI